MLLEDCTKRHTRELRLYGTLYRTDLQNVHNQCAKWTQDPQGSHHARASTRVVKSNYISILRTVKQVLIATMCSQD